MKYLSIMHLLFFLTGCGVVVGVGDAGVIGRNRLTTFEYTNLSEKEGWIIVAPKPNEWKTESKISLLPDLLPNYIMEGTEHNYFFAKYEYLEGEYLAFAIVFHGGFRMYVLKSLDLIHLFPPSWEPVESNTQCKEMNFLNLDMFIKVADIDFNAKKIEFTNNNKSIFAKLSTVGYYNTVPKSYESLNILEIFNEEEEQAKGRRVIKRDLHPVQLIFKVPSVSCKNIENADLLIDGFSYKGRSIPPLKVRINYAADYNIPEYIGPPANGTQPKRFESINPYP